METRMWENEILQQNINKLKKLGYHFIEPEVGKLSTLKIGKGRLVEPGVIVRKVYEIIGKRGKFLGKKIIITAGRSEEDIDSVRCITNRASGKLGYAIAKEIVKEGGEVVLILGPSVVNIEEELKIIKVRTVKEFMSGLFKELELGCDLLVMSAAIGNYTPVTKYSQKLKSPELELKLTRTQDILKEVRKKYPNLCIVGFALETENYIEYGKKKLKDKNLNLIVVNTPEEMGSEFFKGWIIDREEKVYEIKQKSKEEAAKEIVGKLYSLIT
jgi:phosphopantothenoylcysteine decarboxylase/phosphopantothenate--cysteine ligase